MSQAIITKYHGPTNFRGARVSARSQAGARFYAWDDAKGQEENHDSAAMAYAESLGWAVGRVLLSGELPDGTGNAYVLASVSTKKRQ